MSKAKRNPFDLSDEMVDAFYEADLKTRRDGLKMLEEKEKEAQKKKTETKSQTKKTA